MLKAFSEYLEDENFVDWIAHPTPEKEAYWEEYMLKNPKAKEKILIFKKYLSCLETEDQKLSVSEKQEILSRLQDNLDFADNSMGKKVFRLNFLKYAALFLIFISAIIYFIASPPETVVEAKDVFRQVSMDSVQETRLILDDKEQIAIAQGKSEVDYKLSSGAVINRHDTLKINEQSNSGRTILDQLVVPYGKRSKIRLQDGTVVHLNSGSRFVFPRRFAGPERQVYLDGEAFFEVASDRARPFKVKIFKDGKLSIEAVGTSFNINAYDFQDGVYTVLTEGEVHIKNLSNKSLFGQEEKIVMVPGELAEWSVSQGVVKDKRSVDTDLYTTWVDGMLLFRSEPIKNIVKKLEVYYNVVINFDHNADQNFRISGKLDLNDNFEKTMENLVLTSTVKFEKIGSNKFLLYQ